MPVLHLIAGPNGAGKSTLYRTLIAPRCPGLPLINADDYEREHLQPEGDLYRRSELARTWADSARATLLKEGKGFVTETVFSHSSKLELLAQAKLQGFSVVLYVICVDQPQLLLSRVRQRVEEGGHDVPAGKILARYPRTLSLLQEAIGLADLVFLFDGADAMQGGPVLLASIAQHRLHRHASFMPTWAEKLLAAPVGRPVGPQF